MNAVELLQRLHQHRAWVNNNLLTAAANLSDGQLRSEFQIGQGSVWKSLLHLPNADFFRGMGMTYTRVLVHLDDHPSPPCSGPTVKRWCTSLQEAVGGGPVLDEGFGAKVGPFWTRVSIPWAALGEQLTREGYAKIEAVLDSAVCAELRSLFDDDARFAKTVNMDREDFGKGSYRYFQAPLPGIVDSLRRGIYPHVARIANDWQQLLERSGTVSRGVGSVSPAVRGGGVDGADADLAPLRRRRLQRAASRPAWHGFLPDSDGGGAEPAGAERLRRRRVPVLRRARGKEIATPRGRRRPG